LSSNFLRLPRQENSRRWSGVLFCSLAGGKHLDCADALLLRLFHVAFYGSLNRSVQVYGGVPAGRRSRLHCLIGVELEKAYGARVEDNANQLAHHFQYGGDYARAIRYFRLAAEQALRRSAHREAASLLEAGLHLVEEQPETPERNAEEFALRSMMAPTIVAIHGLVAPDAAVNFQRARELGVRLRRVEEMYPLLLHLASMHELRGEFRLAEQILNERLALPRARDGAVVQIDSDMLMACSLFHQGEFSRSTERAKNGVDLYDPRQHANLVAHYGENPAVGCHAWAALSLWCMGYVDQALKHVEQSLELAGHPDLLFSLASAKMRAAHVCQLRRDVPRTFRWASEAGTLAEEHGYRYKCYFALALKGWAVAMAGQLSDGLDMMHRAMALLDEIGAHIDHPYLLALSSEIAAANGEPSTALTQVKEALAIVRESRTYFYEAELYRLRGALVLQINGRAAEDEAEANFRQALEIAARQKARALELRAAVSLCRLLQTRGRPRDGFRILKATYDWFTEGAGTADLMDAETLIAEAQRSAQLVTTLSVS